MLVTVLIDADEDEQPAHIIDVTAADRLSVDDISIPFSLEAIAGQDSQWLDLQGETRAFLRIVGGTKNRLQQHSDGQVWATMHGQVVAVHVSVGTAVKADQQLLSLEAMKMEHRIRATIDGVVSACDVQVGDQVGPGAALVMITTALSEST